MQFFNLFFAVA